MRTVGWEQTKKFLRLWSPRRNNTTLKEFVGFHPVGSHHCKYHTTSLLLVPSIVVVVLIFRVFIMNKILQTKRTKKQLESSLKLNNITRNLKNMWCKIGYKIRGIGIFIYSIRGIIREKKQKKSEKSTTSERSVRPGRDKPAVWEAIW